MLCLSLVDDEWRRPQWTANAAHLLEVADVLWSLGTLQKQERTAQLAPGPLFTEVLTGTGSSKLVDAYRLHPNAIKSLPRCGQGYLLGAAQRGDSKKTRTVEGATPVCYPRLPKELLDGCDYPLRRNDQLTARGLRLYERFVEQAAAVARRRVGSR